MIRSMGSLPYPTIADPDMVALKPAAAELRVKIDG